MLPLADKQYDLSATQFCDQLALRCHHEPVALPAACDGCGDRLSLQHGLDNSQGGLIKEDHNDVCDNDARLATGMAMVVSLLRCYSCQKMTEQDILHCKLIGAYNVF